MPLIRLTHKQLEAARHNRARSRGPKTSEGKARYSHRQAVLNQFRQLRRDWPLPAPSPQPVESEPVDPEIPAATEPGLNPQPVDSMDPPPPTAPGESHETALPETAKPVTEPHTDHGEHTGQRICPVECGPPPELEFGRRVFYTEI